MKWQPAALARISIKGGSSSLTPRVPMSGLSSSLTPRGSLLSRQIRAPNNNSPCFVFTNSVSVRDLAEGTALQHACGRGCEASSRGQCLD